MMEDLLKLPPAKFVTGVIRKASFSYSHKKNSKLEQTARHSHVLCIFFHNSLGSCAQTLLTFSQS